MRTEYDLTKLKGRRNPYAKALKKQVTIVIQPATRVFPKN